MQASRDARPSAGTALGRHVLFGFFGAMIGLGLGQDFWGLASGLALGLLFASRVSLQRALDEQAVRLSRLEEAGAMTSTLPETTVQTTPSPAPHGERDRPVAQPETAAPTATGDLAATRPAETPAAPGESDPARALETMRDGARSIDASASVPTTSALDVPAAIHVPSWIDTGIAALRGFFFGGNTVVRVGLLVLLVGLTLLAKYAADNALFPIEARLACAAGVGLGLAVLGYRLRRDRPGFGLSLQGGGVASLYIVTFFAFRTYALLPAGLAFGLFVGLALATALLSVLQHSEPLIVIGLLGAFAAPVLASTGEGSHVALFSYYALLIVSITVVAARQAWRWPGLVAFYATYIVATAWGVLRYAPEDYATTQPFVLLALALFTGTAVLHAWARPPKLRGFIDGTLVFGTPIVSILYQRALVADRELGLALSAAGFALFYLAWALFLQRRGPAETRPLVESFGALAVGFATMAIPFAFDEALTTAIAWSLEGAGLYWVGARQARRLPRAAGVLLQLGAGVAFLASAAWNQIDPDAFLPLANGRAISCLAIAGSGFFIARTGWLRRGEQPAFESFVTQALGAWALVWWSGGAIAEIDQFVPNDLQPAAAVLLIAVTTCGLEWAGERTDWMVGRLLGLLGLPAAALAMFAWQVEGPHLLGEGGWLVWPLLFAVLVFLWARQASLDRAFLLAYRVGLLWLLGLFVPLALAGGIEQGLGLEGDWAVAGFGAGLAAMLSSSLSLHGREVVPFEREADSVLGPGLGPVAGAAAVTILGLQILGTGDARPLPHVPILNPVDLAVGLLAVTLWAYARRIASVLEPDLDATGRTVLVGLPVLLGFASLNGLLARAVSQWTDVPYRADALWDSVAMQMVLSIAWTLVGLVGMLLSSRQGWRQAWMVCATLLGIVVLKLFTVDLSQLSTVARIGTFLAVGLMLLVLGYFSPVPPSAEPPGTHRTDPPDAASPPGDPIGESA